MVDVSGQEYYDVTYYDNWLEIEDFKSIQADSEEEAREAFWERDLIDEDDRERYDIREVEYAFMIPEEVNGKPI